MQVRNLKRLTAEEKEAIQAQAAHVRGACTAEAR
jgi:hypothetical protein